MLDLIGPYDLRAIGSGLYPATETYPDGVIVVDVSRACRPSYGLIRRLPVPQARAIAVRHNNNDVQGL
jgi:hypothetical protein